MCDQNCKTQEGKAQNSKINGVHLVELLQTPLICSASTDSANKQRSASPWLNGRACSTLWMGILKEFHQNWLPPVTISPAQRILPLSRQWRQHYTVIILFHFIARCTPLEGKAFSPQHSSAHTGPCFLSSSYWSADLAVPALFRMVVFIWKAQVMGEFKRPSPLLIFHISEVNWRWSFHCLL